MPIANLSNVKIHYQLAGPPNAPILVLSNSLGSSLEMWEPQLPTLTQRFRVLRYDTRGHGRSSLEPGPYSIAQLASDVTALIAELGENKVYFCGISMGGLIGMHLALHARESLHKVVLANTAAKIGSPETWNPRIAEVRRGGMNPIAAAAMERWFTPGFRARAPQTVTQMQRMVERTPAEGYIACCEAIRDCDLRDDVKRIGVPTLIISGTHDAACTPRDGQYLAENIRGARYVELDAAHLSNVECASEFTGEVQQFFAA